MSPTSTKQSFQRGFTLVEVAIVAPMLILIVLGIIALLTTLVQNNATQVTRNALIKDARGAFNSIENDVTTSSTFLPGTLPSNFSDPQPPFTNTTYKTNGSLVSGTTSTNLNTLFIQGYNQVADSDSTKTIPAFKGTKPCTSDTDTSMTNIVPIAILYFVKSGDLFRRTIIDTNGTAAACGAPLLINQSCPTNSITPPCTIEDVKLLSGVTKFSIVYYQNPPYSTAMNAYVASPSPTIDQATAISVDITLEKLTAGETVSYSTSLLTSRISN